MKANDSLILARSSCNACKTRKCRECRHYNATKEIIEELKKMPRKGLIFSDFNTKI
jgi:hypothetical protein